MKRITRWHLLLFLGATILFFGFLDQDTDVIGVPVGNTIPLHFVRHPDGAEMIFESVSRDVNSVTLSGQLKGHSKGPLGALINVQAWTKSNSQIFDEHTIILPDDSFEICLTGAPSSAADIHWSIGFDGGAQVNFTTPNPGKSSVSNGFVVGQSTMANGDLTMTLHSLEIDLKHNRVPFPGVANFSVLRDWVTSLWAEPQISAATTADLTLSGHQTGWSIVGCSVESDLDKPNPDFIDLGLSSTNAWRHFDLQAIWPEDGPFKLTAWAIHGHQFTPFSAEELEKLLIVPKPGEVIPINLSYSFGDASVTFVSFNGEAGDKDAGLVYRLKGAYIGFEQLIINLIETPGTIPITPSSSTEVTGFLPFSDPPGTRISLSFTLADEARKFQFVANPVIAHH